MRSEVQLILLTIAALFLARGEIKIIREIDRLESRLEQIERLCIDAAAFAPAK